MIPPLLHLFSWQTSSANAPQTINIGTIASAEQVFAPQMLRDGVPVGGASGRSNYMIRGAGHLIKR